MIVNHIGAQYAEFRIRVIIPLTVFILIFSPALIFSQSPLADDNIQKYWHYRERLKNFIVPSDCKGCSARGHLSLNMAVVPLVRISGVPVQLALLMKEQQKLI